MYDAVKPVESAHLECYVNGKLVASTDKVTEPERFSYNANAIRFKAPFNAGDEVKSVKDGALCNVAPTILKLMGLPQPADMDAEPLI